MENDSEEIDVVTPPPSNVRRSRSRRRSRREEEPVVEDSSRDIDTPPPSRGRSLSRFSKRSGKKGGLLEQGSDDDDVDIVEMKRRQLEHLREKQNLRKFVISTNHESGKKKKAEKLKNKGDENDATGDNGRKNKGIFARLRGRSLSRSRSRSKKAVEKNADEETLRDDDYKHFQVGLKKKAKKPKGREESVSPPPSLGYDDAEIIIKESNSSEQYRSKSRPRVREDYYDEYKPAPSSTEKMGRRTRSLSRRTVRDEESNHHRGSSRTKPRERSRSRPKQREDKRVLNDFKPMENISISHSSRGSSSRPRTKTEDVDDWSPSPSHNKSTGSQKHLPPTAPKRSQSSTRQRDFTESERRSRTPSRSRSRAGVDKDATPPPTPPKQHGQTKRGSRSRTSNNTRDPSSDEPTRGVSRSRSSSRQRDGQSSYAESGHSRQLNAQSRTHSTSSHKSKRSLSSSGRNSYGGKNDDVSSEDSDRKFFVT